MVLELPPPPSVNRTRRVDWKGKRQLDEWRTVADAYVLAAKTRRPAPLRIEKLEQFEIIVVLDEKHNRIDLDNGLKALIDYLKRIEAIVDDGPKHLRRLVVEWGSAKWGCKVIVKGCA